MRQLALRVLPFAVLLVSPHVPAQAGWQIAYPPQSPPPNHQWTAAFDELHGEALFVFARNTPHNQGWRWNGTTWSQLAALPPGRYGANMVWDAARQRIVLWGGTSHAGPYMQDMWEWNGSMWQQRLVAVPPGRDGAAAAFDRTRGVIVMFGGFANGLLDDTWEWNGTAWSNPAPAARPTAREQAMMAFDPSTGHVLLHGGVGAGSLRNTETWTWNGSAWQQRFPLTPPHVRDRGAMVADLDRRRVVLQGGSSFDAQTWEWDGSQWQPSTPGSPGTVRWCGSVYDTARREVVLHGGEFSGLGFLNQTWRYRTATPASAIAFGAGCAGSAGVPVLAAAPYSLPWLGDTVRTRVAVPQGQPGAMFVSSFAQQLPPLDLTVVGMPGCSLLVPTTVVEFEPAAGGAAQWSLAVPNTPALVAVTIHQQAFPLDPAANATGLSASNGLSLTTGIR